MTTAAVRTVRGAAKQSRVVVRPPLDAADYPDVRKMERRVVWRLKRKFPKDIVEDAVQAGLAATALDWRTLKEPEAFMHTAAYNAAVDALRKKETKKSREVLMTTLDIDYFLAPDALDTSIELEDVLSRELLPMAADFARLVMGGASLKEAALELGLGRDAVGLVTGQIREALEAAWGLAGAPSAAAPVCGGPAEAASVLREAAAQLTPRQREAFGLLLLGHKPVAVAQQMGIDANNARVTLHHARQRLGRILGWSADEVSRVIQLCQVQAAEGRRTVPAA